MMTRIGVDASLSVAGKTYRLVRHFLHERLSEVSRLVCELAIDADSPPEPSTLVDQAAVLTLDRDQGGEKRYFVGSVVQVRATDEAIELMVAPRAWRMSRRADCR